MPAPVEVAQDMPTRLRRAQAAVKDSDAAHRLRLKARKGVILEAIDSEGMSHQEVAKILGVAKSRISAILASPDDDDQ